MLQAEQGSNSIGTTCLGMEWKGWIHDKQRGFLTDGDLEIKCGVCFSFGFFFAPTPFQTIPHLLPRKRGIGPCYSSKAIRSSIAIMVKPLPTMMQSGSAVQGFSALERTFT